ncbi:MAG: aldose 1-epimerase family protein [Chloroflexota bacterium]
MNRTAGEGAGPAGVALRRRLGDRSQVASTRAIRLEDGNEDGVRAIDVRVSGGLSALVLADRGLDLGPAWVAGHQVSWQSPTGVVGPAHFDETAWLRSFHGGLLTTCGLQNVGPDCVDDGVRHGLHGRISHIPARNVTHRVVEEAGRLVAEVAGEVREVDVYGDDLVLHRRLRFPAGEPLVEIRDEIENRGFAPAAAMILYHVNVGWPVVDDGARLVAPPAEVIPRDAESAAGLADHARFLAPADGIDPMVFEHVLHDRRATHAAIAVVNPGHAPTGGIGVVVEYDPRELPRLWQWRMLRPGLYLTGLEPASCGIMGRAEGRRAGTLVTLAPGERRPSGVTIRALTGPALARWTETHDATGGTRA